MKKINKNGYVRHSEDDTRLAFEHVRVAEQMLGRTLGRYEEVHHIDGDKENNQPYNLMVMRTGADHHRIHATKRGVECFKTEDGSFIVVYKQNTCPFCLRLFQPNSTKQTYCSNECYSLHKSRNIPSRNELITVITSKNSFVAVGEHYNVSDNTIRKWCRKYGLPTKLHQYTGTQFSC